MDDYKNRCENLLCDLFNEFSHRHDFPEGDAEELILRDDLTQQQREWLSAFILLWDSTVNEE